MTSPDRDTFLMVRCTPEQKEQWRRLAAKHRVSLSEYVRALLDAMAKKEFTE